MNYKPTKNEYFFDIQLLETFWLGTKNTENDLCAHGKVRVSIGTSSFINQGATVSATALLLLRSLEREHTKEHPLGEHLLPCCGHFLIYTPEMKEVHISGCYSGDNWAILHQKNTVVLRMENGYQTTVPFKEYLQTVLTFVDQVEAFYNNNPKKVLPEDDFDRVGYLRFWKEWRMHRAKWIRQ